MRVSSSLAVAGASALFLVLTLVLSQPTVGVEASNSFSGANSYFLWSLSESDRKAHLSALSAAGVNVVRIFVVHVDAGNKGSSAQGTPDLEEWQVGNYQDTILDRIDVLMKEARDYGVKLNLVFHDRYSLGVWQKDGYFYKYGSAEEFYTNPNAQADFDRRLQHILDHKNPYFNSRPWRDLGEVVWAFAIQNEARGHMPDFHAPWTWHCGRAKLIRPLINQTIYVTTGGGADWADSYQDGNFACAEIDVIGVHNYDQSQSEVEYQLSAGVAKALSYKKRIIYEEFGATGAQQASVIGSQADAANRLGVPFWPWEFVKCSGGDYEHYVGSAAWSVHQAKAAAARNANSPFNWSGGGGGGGGKKGDWQFCSASDQCADGCCSKQYSNDGRYKCTPGGTQCI